MSIGQATGTSLLINQDVVVYQNQQPGKKLQNCCTAICEGHPPEDSHRVARVVTKLFAGGVSLVAKIPFIPISLKLGPILAPASIIGNMFGFFILEYWAAAETINDVLEPKTQAEKELNQENQAEKGKTCRMIVIISIASLIALSSQMPTALAGVQYNQEGYKVVAGLVLLIAGALIPIRSLHLSAKELWPNIKRVICQRKDEFQVKEIQRKMLALITGSHETFIQKNWASKILFIQDCNRARNPISSPEEKTNQYILTLLQKEDLQISRAKKIVASVFNYTGLTVGALLTLGFEFALGEYTFDLTKNLIWDNNPAAGIFTVFAVGSTAYLFGKNIITTTQKVFNLFGNLIIGKEVRNLGWQLRPKLSFALTALGFLIDVAALGPTYVIWENFYSSNEIEHQIFPATLCTSLFLILFTATLSIIDEVVISSIKRGSQEEQAIIKINGEFQKLARIMQNCPAREFIAYLANIDDSTREKLLERMAISAEQLEQLRMEIFDA